MGTFQGCRFKGMMCVVRGGGEVNEILGSGMMC